MCIRDRRPAVIIAARPTGPAPMTATTSPGLTRPLRTPISKPVGRMSESGNAASSLTPAGSLCREPSAKGTGICQPVWGTDLHLLLSGGLLRLGLVDPRRSRRAGRGGRLVDEPFGVGGVRRVKDAGPFGVDGLGAPVVHVGRDVQP